MRLIYKLTLINAFTRILIVAAFLVFVPDLIKKAAVTQIDSNLEKKQNKVLHIISKVGMSKFLAEESDSTYGDSSFSDYTIFKENYVSIEKIPGSAMEKDTIINSSRDLEGE